MWAAASSVSQETHTHTRTPQCTEWCKPVTNYISSSAVLDILVLYFIISTLRNVILLLIYISEANIVLFALPHLSHSFNHQLLYRLCFFTSFLSNENHVFPNAICQILNVNVCDKLKDRMHVLFQAEEILLLQLNNRIKNPLGFTGNCIVTALRTGCFMTIYRLVVLTGRPHYTHMMVSENMMHICRLK